MYFNSIFGGVACSIRAIFVIHVEIVSNGIDHSVTRPLIRDYGKTKLATYTWDSLQGQRRTNTEFPIPSCREVSPCFVLGVPLPCMGSS